MLKKVEENVEFGMIPDLPILCQDLLIQSEK